MNNLDFMENIDSYKLDEEGKQKFKDRLITLRKKNGWSQEELGGKLDVSRQTVSKWESNDTMPEMDKLIKLSKIYNLTMDELVYGSEKVDKVDNDYRSLDDENNKLKEDLIIIENTSEDNDSSTDNNDINDLPFKDMKSNLDKKKNLKKFIIRTFIFVIIAIIVGYVITVAHRFSILKEINDKFNSYKDVNNCYYERNEVVSNNTGTLYMINTKYWYKDGVLKKEESRTESNCTNVAYTFIDLNNNIKYKLSNSDYTGIKYSNYENNEIDLNNIFKFFIGTNYYYEINIEMIKDALLSDIKIKDEKYIIEKDIKGYKKKIFDKKTSFIEQNYYEDADNEETRITHNIRMGVVTNEDVKINLENYNIIDEKI